MYHYDCDNMNNKEAKYYFTILNVVVKVLKLHIYILYPTLYIQLLIILIYPIITNK